MFKSVSKSIIQILMFYQFNKNYLFCFFEIIKILSSSEFQFCLSLKFFWFLKAVLRFILNSEFLFFRAWFFLFIYGSY